MGIWDKLKKSLLGGQPTVQETPAKVIDRKAVPANEIDALQRMPASPNYQRKIHERFYPNYPEKPFVSKDRELNTNWIEQTEFTLEHMKTNPLVTIDKMTRFSDGLLPGHIYMLYWIGKNSTEKRIPSYFEYKYGIEFEKERQFLVHNGYLAEGKPTAKGADAIVVHFEIVEQHSPESLQAKKVQQQFVNSENISVAQDAPQTAFAVSRTYTINGKNLMVVADNDRARVLEDIATINKLLVTARKELNVKEPLKILETHILFNESFNDKLFTYLEYEPLTASGKQAKYPFILHITTKNHYEAMPLYECFGTVSYLRDNRMGSATLHYWYKNVGYHVSLGLLDDCLSVKKIEQSIGGTKTTIYKK